MVWSILKKQKENFILFLNTLFYLIYFMFLVLKLHNSNVFLYV